MQVTKKNNRAIDVYLERRKTREYVGRLSKQQELYIFKYDDKYVFGNKSISIGPDLPLSHKKITSRMLFPSFEDRIPSKKNPAYKEYCKYAGISPKEANPFILLSTIGRKGPSSFIFAPVHEEEFSSNELIEFRKELNLSIREFADLFDFAPTTINRIENKKISGKESLKRIELYKKFPQTAMYELDRSGYKINEKSKEFLKKYFENLMQKEGLWKPGPDQ